MKYLSCREWLQNESYIKHEKVGRDRQPFPRERSFLTLILVILQLKFCYFQTLSYSTSPYLQLQIFIMKMFEQHRKVENIVQWILYAHRLDSPILTFYLMCILYFFFSFHSSFLLNGFQFVDIMTLCSWVLPHASAKKKDILLCNHHNIISAKKINSQFEYALDNR